MTGGSIFFAFLAGLFSVLSPCVLPLLPIVLGAAASEHRYGAAALASGVALAFTAIGILLATAGYAVGLDAGTFRTIAAVLLIAIGAALVSAQLSERLAVAAGPAAGKVEAAFGGFDTSGLKGQFLLGLLLGTVWSPCVGPTLGAASLLAAEGKDLAHVFTIMLAFGIGAALPLLLLGTLSREAVMRIRGHLLAAGKSGKAVLGALLIGLGLLVLTGLDKSLETWVVRHSPAWLTELTTLY